MGCKIFELGMVYCATPALRGARQRLVIPIGRQGERMQVALVDDFSVADLNVEIAAVYGREFAVMMMSDGRYTMSAACHATPEQVKIVHSRLGVRK